jgi:hypothetical protein
MVQLLYVEEATDLVYTELEEFTGWKFLKSQRCLKRKIKDIELYIKFSTSKWKKLPVQNTVAYYEYRPKTGDDLYWYDISGEEKLRTVINALEFEIKNTALKLTEQLENNMEKAIQALLDEGFEGYHVRLDFVADILGADAIKPRVKNIVMSLSDEEKQQIKDYRNGARTKKWMLNPTNLKYIVDNGYDSK